MMNESIKVCSSTTRLRPINACSIQIIQFSSKVESNSIEIFWYYDLLHYFNKYCSGI